MSTIEAVRIDPVAISEIIIPRALDQLRTKLETFVKNSIAQDTFERVTPEVLFSTSLVDFFTALNQNINQFVTLPFITNQIITEKLAPMVMSVVQSYNTAMQQLCISELSDKQGSSVIDFSSMNKKVEQRMNRKNEDQEGLNLPLTLLTKLNNMDATEQQAENLLKAMICDESSDEASSGEESESEGDENEQKIDELMETISIRIDELLDDIIARITSQFQFTIDTVLDTLLANFDKAIMQRDTLGEALMVQLMDIEQRAVTDLFDQFITPALSILSRSLYSKLFKRVLISLFAQFCKCFELLYIPSRFMDGSSQYDTKPVSANRVTLILSVMEFVIEYFYGDGEGLSKETMSIENDMLFRLISYERVPSDKIVESYELGTIDIPERYVLGILTIRNDPRVSQFMVKILDNRLKYVFSIKTQLSELITTSSYCWNEYYHLGYLYLTKTNHLLFESYVMKNYGTKTCIPHIKDPIGATTLPSFIHISKHVFKIYLPDVVDVRYKNTLFHNSLVVKFDTKHPKNILVLYFRLTDKKSRAEFGQALLNQLILCNNRVEWRKHDPTVSVKDKELVTSPVDNGETMDMQKMMVDRFQLSSRDDPKYIASMIIRNY